MNFIFFDRIIMKDGKYMIDKIKKFFKENYKFLIVLFLIVVIFRVELPYKVYTPGGMVNLSNRVKVEGGYDTSGELGMAYVSMVRGSVPFILLSYILPDWDLVKEEDITLENESFEEMFQKDKIATQQSIDAAIIASYKLAGKEVHVSKEIVHLTYIDKNAKTDLKIFDIILSVDGESISSTDELKSIITKHQVGDKVTLKILRDEKEMDATAEVYLLDGEPKIGVSLTVTYDYSENPRASIETKQSESGPSGGLMMALALYNSLVEEDITKGKRIIGTGTIDVSGNVGEIGGVRYKLIGAVKKKADVFLVPEGNYEEAVNVKNEKGYDIKLISVKTLEDAIEALKKL